MQTIRKHMSPGIVLGIIAIVIALTGTSIAAIKLKANTVGAKQLKPITTASTNVALPGHSAVEGIANCPTGSDVISGGGKIDNATVGENQFTLESYKSGNGWYVRVGNSGNDSRTLTVEAYCLKK